MYCFVHSACSDRDSNFVFLVSTDCSPREVAILREDYIQRSIRKSQDMGDGGENYQTSESWGR